MDGAHDDDGAGQLSEASDAGIRRFDQLVTLAFAASAAVFLIVAGCGYLTFGAAAAGNLLTNYAVTDSLAHAARVALAISLLAGYPLAFASLKGAVHDACGGEQGPVSPRVVSVALLALLTSAASICTDLGFVSSFAGALLGSAIIYVFPSLMFHAALKQRGLLPSHRPQALLARLISLTGVMLMGLGGWATIVKRCVH